MKNRIGWSSSSIFLNCFLVRCSFIIIGIQVGIEAGCDRKRGVVRLRPGLCVPPGRRPASSWPDQIAGGDPQIHSFDISEMRKISSFPKGVTDNIIIDFLLEFDQMGFKQKLLKSIEFLLAFKRLAVKLPWHLCSRFEVSYCSFMTGCGSSNLQRNPVKVKQYKPLKTYLENLAVISDIFSGGAVFVPHQMIAVEKLCFGTSNKSERKSNTT